jgi:NhaP-type Na+/H+ or K+/H+ antiporter
MNKTLLFFVLFTYFLCYNEIIGIRVERWMEDMSTNLLITLLVIFLTTVAITILIKIPEGD